MCVSACVKKSKQQREKKKKIINKINIRWNRGFHEEKVKGGEEEKLNKNTKSEPNLMDYVKKKTIVLFAFDFRMKLVDCLS